MSIWNVRNAEAERHERRFRTAAEHRVGIVVANQPECVADADRAGRAAHAIRAVGALEAELDGDVAARRAHEDVEREQRGGHSLSSAHLCEHAQRALQTALLRRDRIHAQPEATAGRLRDTARPVDHPVHAGRDHLQPRTRAAGGTLSGAAAGAAVVVLRQLERDAALFRRGIRDGGTV